MKLYWIPNFSINYIKSVQLFLTKTRICPVGVKLDFAILIYFKPKTCMASPSI